MAGCAVTLWAGWVLGKSPICSKIKRFRQVSGRPPNGRNFLRSTDVVEEGRSFPFVEFDQPGHLSPEVKSRWS